jgi:hypothetical protein
MSVRSIAAAWRRRLTVAAGAGLVALPAFPQTFAGSTPVELYVACIKAAIDSKEVSLEIGAFIRFSCHGDIARAFYEKLETFGFQAREREAGGETVREIEFDYPDACRRKKRVETGAPAYEYGCSLNFHGSGAVLGKR